MGLQETVAPAVGLIGSAVQPLYVLLHGCGISYVLAAGYRQGSDAESVSMPGVALAVPAFFKEARHVVHRPVGCLLQDPTLRGRKTFKSLSKQLTLALVYQHGIVGVSRVGAVQDEIPGAIPVPWAWEW